MVRCSDLRARGRGLRERPAVSADDFTRMRAGLDEFRRELRQAEASGLKMCVLPVATAQALLDHIERGERACELTAVRLAAAEYRNALRNRQHGGVAAGAAMRAILDALGLDQP